MFDEYGLKVEFLIAAIIAGTTISALSVWLVARIIGSEIRRKDQGRPKAYGNREWRDAMKAHERQERKPPSHKDK